MFIIEGRAPVVGDRIMSCGVFSDLEWRKNMGDARHNLVAARTANMRRMFFANAAEAGYVLRDVMERGVWPNDGSQPRFEISATIAKIDAVSRAP